MPRRNDHVTLVPKIIVTRRGLEVWWLFGILGIIGLIVLATFAGQLVICQELHPEKTSWECLRP